MAACEAFEQVAVVRAAATNETPSIGTTGFDRGNRRCGEFDQRGLHVTCVKPSLEGDCSQRRLKYSVPVDLGGGPTK